MATVKQELREFYANQGLTGKALRSAMRYDLRSIRKQGLYIGGCTSADGLECIDWYKGVEGTGYWLSRALGFPSWSYRGRNGALRTIR